MLVFLIRKKRNSPVYDYFTATINDEESNFFWIAWRESYIIASRDKKEELLDYLNRNFKEFRYIEMDWTHLELE